MGDGATVACLDPIPEGLLEEEPIQAVAGPVPVTDGPELTGGAPGRILGDDGQPRPGRGAGGQVEQGRAARCQLFQPWRRYAGEGVGGEDPVEGGQRQPERLAVAGDERRMQTESGEVVPSGFGDVRIAVEGDHVAVPTDPRRNRASHRGAGPDVRDP